MVDSKRVDGRDLVVSTQRFLDRWIPAGAGLCAGLSGGVDSVVLLHVLRTLRDSGNISLSALHVHHGLSPNADEWSKFCAEICANWNIPFELEQVQVSRNSGSGIEAAARGARYAAYARHDTGWIALAHHQDDQAETLLLQLLRGSGPKGLAAMPAVRSLGPTRPTLLRPFLEIPRAAIEAYAKRQALRWIEDESNRSTAFDRNFLRRSVLPELEVRFPGYRDAFARSARLCAEADCLLSELAQRDLAQCSDKDAIHIDRIAQLSDGRVKNALRHYITSNAVTLPNSLRLEEFARQLRQYRAGSTMAMTWGTHSLRVSGGHLMLEQAGSGAEPATMQVNWSREVLPTIPWADGQVKFEPRKGEGLSIEKLRRGNLQLQARQGGEKMHVAANRPRRTLKNMLQESHVPHWLRWRIPLLYCSEELAWVAGIGIDCRFVATGDEPGLVPIWERIADPTMTSGLDNGKE